MFIETKNIRGDKYTAVNIEEIFSMEARNGDSKIYLNIRTTVYNHIEEFLTLSALKVRVNQIIDLINLRNIDSCFFDFNKDVSEYPHYIDIYKIISMQMFLSTLENALVLFLESRNEVLKYEDQNICKGFYYQILELSETL